MLMKECISKLHKEFEQIVLKNKIENISSSIFPNYSNNAGRSYNFLIRLLHYFNITDSYDFIRFLIQKIYYTERELYDTIMCCVKFGNCRVLNSIINNNKNISKEFIKKHLGEFILASSKYGSVGVIVLLLEHLHDKPYDQINYTDAITGNTPLMVALKHNHTRFVQQIIKLSDVNIKNENGKTIKDYNEMYWTDKYKIWRVHSYMSFNKQKTQYNLIKGFRRYSDSLENQEKVVSEYIDTVKWSLNRNILRGVNQDWLCDPNKIYPLYDKIFIIKDSENIIEYKGDAYYDMRDLLYLQNKLDIPKKPTKPTKPMYTIKEWNMLYRIILIVVFSILLGNYDVTI